MTVLEAPEVTWPSAGTYTVSLDGGDTIRRSSEAIPSPVTVTGAEPPESRLESEQRSYASVEIHEHDQAQGAGVDGLLFTVRLGDESDGSRTAVSERAEVEVDYSSFAHAYGGGYGARLTLVALPACVVDTPELAECRERTAVRSSNDTEQQVLTAGELPLNAGEPLVLAAVAEEEGGQGDYTATELSPSATWNVALNSGDFTWSYDMAAPDVPGGLAPSLALSYSSGTIDGRTGGTNNQGSWVGDGFALSPAYIERRYLPCAEEGVENTDGNRVGDLCWDYDNAFITMDGAAGELVPDGEDTWRLPDDDGTVVERLTGTGRSNGARDDEHWRVTDPDGVQYYFGYQRLPGWGSGDETTDSTWTVPVFGDDTDDPCHASAMKDSWCRQAWRWNLDYVVDPHGNAMAYYYDKEENSYSRFLDEDANTRYTRGGSLDRIEYGLASADLYTTPLAKVEFTGGNRCLPGGGASCGDIDTHAQYFYDTPWDLNCGASEDCDAGRFSPSFWTTRRLTEVATFVHTGGAYKPVDSWAFNHRWGTADVDYQLLLASIRRTGHTASSPLTLPPVTFGYEDLVNRLDETGDGYAPFVKARLSSIADESGGQIEAVYSGEACRAGSLPTPQSNTTRCFPQYLGNGPDQDPDLEWFNKYVVTSVTQVDRTRGGPDRMTRYDYRGGAAWHWDENGLIPDDERTWSQWRGYGHVRVTHGDRSISLSQTDSYFLRGMHGDRATPSGGTKDVSVTLGTGEGDPISDHSSAAGFLYRTVNFDGPGGKILEKTVSRPWRHQTASESHDWGTLRSHFTGTARTATWTSLDQGAGDDWRITEVNNTYDTVAGRPITVDDRGDTSTTADDQCARTTYASDTIGVPLNLPSRVETVAVRCSATPDRATDVMSDERYAYDGNGYGVAPEAGDLTATASLSEHNGTTATYLESGSTYDRYGRPLTTTDLTATITVTDGSLSRVRRSDGRTSVTGYSPTTGFATSVTETTPPAIAGDADTAQTTTSTFESLRGQPVDTRDTNGRETVLAYDALGRSTRIWLPDRDVSDQPSYTFSYRFTEGLPVVVSTRTPGVDGGQDTFYAFYDGFLRPRQTQGPGPDGGRLLTDTFYDLRGLVDYSFDTYFTQGAPSNQLFLPSDANTVEAQTQHEYDGLGRETVSRLVRGNGVGYDVLSTTRTYYFGDRVTVLPPEGETATTTLTDARGRTTEIRQLHSHNVTSAYDSITYGYTPRGELSQAVDPAGNTWSYTYDQRGRRTSSQDPDAGTTTFRYDDRAQLVEITGARGATLAYRYDGLGRKTELHEDNLNGPLLASWEFDTLPAAEGQLAASTRYEDGAEYATRVLEYDEVYRPVRSEVTIPDTEGALAGSYETGTAFTEFGMVESTTLPAVGQLPELTLTPQYEPGTLRQTALTGSSGLHIASSYTNLGQLRSLILQHDEWYDEFAQVLYEYERGTRRLTSSVARRYMAPGSDRGAFYRYDEAGNVLTIQDTSNTGTDVQCFQYDYLRRLTEAWAQGQTSCAANPSDSTMGGPAPYWHSYTYDEAGNRLTESRHEEETERDYSYPETGSGQPHTLTSVTEDTPDVRSLEQYTYDESGNTLTRQIGGDTATLAWGAEGRLTSVEEADGDRTEYVYDADGNRLIGRTPTETTLYLGHTELILPNGSDTVRATRYVDAGERNMVVLQDDGSMYYTLADHHGTGQLAVDAYTLDIARRRTLPFGETRGDAPDFWPGTRGFVGGTTDTSTGLTHLGAREYDPALGRFISVDPILDLTDTQQINGYAYANNSPVSFSDPTGLRLDCGADSPSGIPCPQNGAVDSSGNRKVGRAINNRTVAPSSRQPIAFNDALQSHLNNRQSEACNCVWPPRRPPEPTPEPEPTHNSSGFWDIVGRIVEVGTEVGLEAMGVNDAKSCFRGDDPAACVMLGIGFATGGAGRIAASGLRYADEAASVLDDVVGAARSCARHSFLAGTDVRMADGTSKNIEDVEIGDVVLATDPDTGETGPRTVTATIITDEDKEYTELTLRTGEDTYEDIIATAHHPFWSDTTDSWTYAADLTPGTDLRTADGTPVTITATHTYTGTARTYDLTIADLHTYYVLAGTTPVLVHNCGGGAADLGHLTDRADDLHSLIPSGGQQYRTTGVLHADGIGGGIDLSAVGARSNLTLIQRADSLDAGELAISMSNGAHAEVKLLTAAQHLGLSPGGIAASRPFCPACSQFLTNQGATLVSPRTALWLPPGLR
ncbi:RHS repeat-associated core domain-containing protein [Streptomyces sp. NPDC049879]|uniref:RHS repeat-associated core domain-containing protein n=1 Tax=Streptomyces sp. NPDC049879 TaxID=3365598 RepID=UPI0037B4A85C